MTINELVFLFQPNQTKKQKQNKSEKKTLTNLILNYNAMLDVIQIGNTVCILCNCWRKFIKNFN